MKKIIAIIIASIILIIFGIASITVSITNYTEDSNINTISNSGKALLGTGIINVIIGFIIMIIYSVKIQKETKGPFSIYPRY